MRLAYWLFGWLYRRHLASEWRRWTDSDFDEVQALIAEARPDILSRGLTREQEDELLARRKGAA